MSKPAQRIFTDRNVPIVSGPDIRRPTANHDDDVVTSDSGCHSGFFPSTGVISDYVECDAAAAAAAAIAQPSIAAASSASSSASSASSKASTAIDAAAACATLAAASPSRPHALPVTIGSRLHAVDSGLLCDDYADHDHDQGNDDDDDDDSNSHSEVTATDTENDESYTDSDDLISMHVDPKCGANEWTCSGPIGLSDKRNNLTPAGLRLMCADRADGDGDRRWRIPLPQALSEQISAWRACYTQNELGET